ncbi:hypothetical protein MYX07_07140, partial [Patescibacteria group bacterium AH-259-L07]|nr:hypothetical protein [Patescibacteria group bacterium AH-259-L07]
GAGAGAGVAVSAIVVAAVTIAIAIAIAADISNFQLNKSFIIYSLIAEAVVIFGIITGITFA